MSTTAYLGRALKVLVQPQNGSTATTIASFPQTPSLRVTFEVQTMMGVVAWPAEIVIYNLRNQTAAGIVGGSALSQMGQNSAIGKMSITEGLVMGDLVTLAAGYQNSASGAFSLTSNLLYAGNLLQSFATRENVVDTKLKLRCILNLAAVSFGFSNFASQAGGTDWTVLNKILNDNHIPIDNIDPASQQTLQAQKYPRPQVVFKRPLEAIDNIAKQHQINTWLGPNGLNMRTYGLTTEPPLLPDYAYGPPDLSSYTSGGTSTGIVKPTLIGVPEQTQNGIIFRVLLDSQVKIGNVVQVATGTSINAFQFNYGQTLPPVPNGAGIYRVVGVRHVGDTRGTGEDWFTEITGLTQQFFFENRKVRTPGPAPAPAAPGPAV